MIINLVFVHVKSDRIDQFKEASTENAAESRREPGVIRFDLLQETEDSSRFVLVEAFQDAAAVGKHKETLHYRKWKETVESMMAEPRKSIRCADVSFPR